MRPWEPFEEWSTISQPPSRSRPAPPSRPPPTAPLIGIRKVFTSPAPKDSATKITAALMDSEVATISMKRNNSILCYFSLIIKFNVALIVNSFFF
ncbi:hypothetical protein PUN28_008428 [Cardiocondyla obscurior]|uniref:Uncharacterized protein n=1 Tax=Cardiocondyla obscurior TaxID=286306 RepID=A0AAW2G0R8_9HYME